MGGTACSGHTIATDALTTNKEDKMSNATTHIVGHDFADLPALLIRAGLTELVPETAGVSAEGGGHEPPSPPAGVPAPALEPVEYTADATARDHDIAAEQAGGDSCNLQALLAELAGATAMLADLAQRDEQERQAALAALERYDAACAALADAEAVSERAGAVQAEARRIVEAAFSAATRSAAQQVLDAAAAADATASEAAAERGRRVRALESQPNIQRALAERRRLQEEERRRAEDTARAARRQEALAPARVAADAGGFDEAVTVLTAVAKEHPGDAEIDALLEDVRWRRLTRRRAAALRELAIARRELRSDPQAAVSRLAAIDLRDLPAELVARVHARWLDACARLCRARGVEQALRCAPGRGRGAVLIREAPAGPYVVLSALGMDDQWRPGRAVHECVAKVSRPLRP